MSHTLAALLVLLIAAAATAEEGDERRRLESGVDSPAARRAATRFDRAVRAIEKDYRQEIDRVRKRYADELKAARKELLEKGELDEAQAVLALEKHLGRLEPPEIGADTNPRVPRVAATFDGGRYLLVNEPVPKRVAVARCAERGGSLVRVDSHRENRFLVELMAHNGAGPVFVDGDDEEREGEWRNGDGAPLTYANWQQGQPTANGKTFDGAENAIGVNRKGEWFDISSDVRMAYVIEWR